MKQVIRGIVVVAGFLGPAGASHHVSTSQQTPAQPPKIVVYKSPT